MDDLADLSLDAAADHSVDGILLTMNYLVSVQLLLGVRMDFGVEGELLYRFLVLDFDCFLVPPLLEGFLLCHLVENLGTTITCLAVD